jgi:two-component system, NarL family, response regulator LiaR
VEPVGNNSILRRRIVIADDHPLYRDALKQLLSLHSDLLVLAEAENGRDAIEVCRRLRPEVVLMDVHMPTMDGIAATREIKSELPLTIVLMLTALEDSELLSEALRAGAAGYVLKYATKEEIVAAIRGVLSGEFPINHTLSSQLLMRLHTQKQQNPDDLLVVKPPSQHAGAGEAQRQHPLLESLTPRELEVLQLIAKGQHNRQIAENLHVSVNTVKNHVRRVMNKLKVSDRTQAAVLAIELGLRGANRE